MAVVLCLNEKYTAMLFVGSASSRHYHSAPDWLTQTEKRRRTNDGMQDREIEREMNRPSKQHRGVAGNMKGVSNA